MRIAAYKRKYSSLLALLNADRLQARCLNFRSSCRAFSLSASVTPEAGEPGGTEKPLALMMTNLRNPYLQAKIMLERAVNTSAKCKPRGEFKPT